MVKFHCWVVAATQCSGTSRPIKLFTLPVKPGLHCSGLVDRFPFPKVQFGEKPVKSAARGTKAGSSTPRGGIRVKLPLGWNRLVRLPAPGRKLTAMGKNGAENDRLSTAPKSSRTLKMPYPARIV